MDNLILATQTGGILKPFAWILGKILEIIYDLFSTMGIYNIGFCIILFMIIIPMITMKADINVSLLKKKK